MQWARDSPLCYWRWTSETINIWCGSFHLPTLCPDPSIVTQPSPATIWRLEAVCTNYVPVIRQETAGYMHQPVCRGSFWPHIIWLEITNKIKCEIIDFFPFQMYFQNCRVGDYGCFSCFFALMAIWRTEQNRWWKHEAASGVSATACVSWQTETERKSFTVLEFFCCRKSAKK